MIPKNNHKESTANTIFFPQYFIKILEEFNHIPYMVYRKRQVKNDPTEDYLFLAKQIYHLLKNKRHFILRNKRIKYGVINKKHVIKTIKDVITSTIEIKYMRSKEMRMCNCETNKGEKTSSMYDNEEEKQEETLNARDGETANAYVGEI